MLRDFLKRKDIEARAEAIAAEIANRYPLQLDQRKPRGGKAERKKQTRRIDTKLSNAVAYGQEAIRKTISEMKLGVYGKAKLYKSVQDRLLQEGYATETARTLIEQFTMSLRRGE